MKFASTTEPRAYFRDKLAGREREVFAAAFFNTRHRRIECAELFQGTIDGAEVHLCEVMCEASIRNWTSLIVACNHRATTRSRARPTERSHGAPEAGANAGGHAFARPLRYRWTTVVVPGLTR